MTSSAKVAPVDKSLARDRLTSARQRLSEFLALGDRIAQLPQERQQLIQEFFFHTVGAIEMVSQLVSQGRSLGISPEKINPFTVAKALAAGDPMKAVLVRLCANPGKDPIPSDPYSKAGYVWRLWNYRHQVSHRGRNPFLFRVGSVPLASLRLDPRDPSVGESVKSVQDELQAMLDMVERESEAILAHLP